MKRKAHTRPLWTLTRRLRFDWRGDRNPELGDVTVETDTDRYFSVVGIEEHRDSPRVWWLTLERISPEEAALRVWALAPFWEHSVVRRDRPPR